MLQPINAHSGASDASPCSCSQPVCDRVRYAGGCECSAPSGHRFEGLINMIRRFAHRLEVAHTDKQAGDVLLGLALAEDSLRKHLGLATNPIVEAERTTMTPTIAVAVTCLAFAEAESAPYAAAIANSIRKFTREIIADTTDEATLRRFDTCANFADERGDIAGSVHATLKANRAEIERARAEHVANSNAAEVG